MLLELFRNHKRWLMFIAMVLVIPSFVVTGIYSYNRMISDDGAIAKVDDVSILPQQFDEAKRQRLENLRVRLGEAFRTNMLDSQEARVALLEQLMNERSLVGEVASESVVLGEQTAIEMIKTFPAFQTDGHFDADKYRNYLASVGYSDEYFVHMIGAELSRSLLSEGITRTAIVPDSVSESVYNLLTEKREVEFRRIPAANFVKDIKVSDEEAQKFWQDNQKQFERPDLINVEYVVFTPALFADVQPSEEDIKVFYEQNANRFKSAEERRASHILIDFGEGKEKAKAKADEVLAKVKADPENFAKYAKEFSADPGSAKDGGDLSWFGKGVMVPQFEQAVFSAKDGDIVGPVESEFGYHIIKVTGVKPESLKPLDEVRAEIVKLYQEQESQKRFAEEAENFTNMVYEQSDTLAGVIEKYKLTPHTANGISAQGSSDPEVARFVNQHVVESLFSEECLTEKRNTQAIEVAPNTLVSARVTKFEPAHIAPFADVKSDILASLTQQKANDEAQKSGTELLEKLRAGSVKPEEFSKGVTVSRSNPAGLNFEVINALMRVDAKTLPAYIGVKGNDGFTIVHVLKSEMMPADKDQIANVRSEISSMMASADQTVYLQALRAKHKAKVLNKDYMPGAETSEEK